MKVKIRRRDFALDAMRKNIIFVIPSSSHQLETSAIAMESQSSWFGDSFTGDRTSETSAASAVFTTYASSETIPTTPEAIKQHSTFTTSATYYFFDIRYGILMLLHVVTLYDCNCISILICEMMI